MFQALPRNAHQRAERPRHASDHQRVEMQSIPCHTPVVRALKSEFPDMVLHIDHFGQPNRGTPAEYRQVLELARLPRVYMRVEPLSESNASPTPPSRATMPVRSVTHSGVHVARFVELSVRVATIRTLTQPCLTLTSRISRGRTPTSPSQSVTNGNSPERASPAW